ncbi:uncharacterized protein LOC119664260, partial [Teleopsis dalmanni]|uniref:uncharacterized protein LOC119664260 n=1 Tax=Teleopsis dalmanni TaxID=139649 RepID=UPI0018CD459B
MFHLSTNLAGEPKALIRHLPISEQNYNIAWDILSNRYDNKQLLVTALLNKLLSQPNITIESASSLKGIHDVTKECYYGLAAQGIDVKSWDAIMVHVIIRKLDKASHTAFEQSLEDSRRIISLKELLRFLEGRFQAFESMTNGNHKQSHKPRHPAVALAATDSGSKCITCNSSHQLFSCETFKRKSIQQKYDLLKRHKLCTNCMKPGHMALQCSSRSCTICQRRHNTLLHQNRHPVQPSNHKLVENTSRPLAQTTLMSSINHGHTSCVLLGTAKLLASNSNGRTVECRVVLDSGLQINIVTERLASRLGLQVSSSSICIEGIGIGKLSSKSRTTLSVQSKVTDYKIILEAFVLPKIVSNQPSQHLQISNWNLPNNIQLADPTFYKSDKIDMLLGAEFYHQLLSPGQIQLSRELPILQNTVLGWIVEEVDTHSKVLSIAEQQCEAQFTQTTYQNVTGRFIVRLPFINDRFALGGLKDIATNRFLALERRLSKDSHLKRQYVEFLDEYEKLGHMTEIDIERIMSPHYFIPHHCVLKPDSTTTKLRVVFDASSKTTSGQSLNDLLHIGPTVESELLSILLRFRLPRYVFTTDIEKMYRQILVHPEDRQCQLIVWRNEPSQPIRYFELNTVTYGTRSAPYLATKCLQVLADDNMQNYPLGASAFKQNFYVDDCLHGADSLRSLLETQSQLNKILTASGFKLRKWCANHPSLLQGIPHDDLEVNLDLENNDTTKTLGLSWCPKSDSLCVKVKLEPVCSTTKSSATSDLARLFDPLGLLSPVVVMAKIFIQELWNLKMDWDEKLPTELHKQWLEFRNNLTKVNCLQISRHIFKGEVPANIQLHIFTDASEKAYGAAAYLRSTLQNGQIIVRLLCAKSRVAPLKRLTLPRLELCAAVVGAELATRIKNDLQIRNYQTFFWCDSQIVISWINSPSSKFHTFVANRVSNIHHLTATSQWRHVSSEHNPADILSRGLAPHKLQSSIMWFYGLMFLHGREELWPSKPSSALKSETLIDPERKKETPVSILSVVEGTANPGEFIYSIRHNNSFGRLQRILSYILRFVKRTRRKQNDHSSNFLTPDDLDAAHQVIIKSIQYAEFKNEIKIMKSDGRINKSSALASLAPFTDNTGIIRVGGRLDAASLSYDAKHPMLLPYNNPIVKLIMEQVHKKYMHCGPQSLLANMRQRYWPIKGKLMARSVVQHCVRCTKVRPRFYEQLMGNLAATRVQPGRPFLTTGVDFCGPFWIHYRIRGKKPHKVYIAVYCCFTTKAVHLEVVSDLTTDAFIGSLKRFIARRGHCKNLFCDNATNFVGASNQLLELADSIQTSKAQEKIINECNERGITFKFIPPRAPHFGGLWEAAVKSAKHLLIRSTKTTSLTYEELETVVLEVEAILNSRPLTPMSSNPNDLSALTPGHFLIGEPLTAMADAKAQSGNINLVTRWKLVSRLKLDFWERWKTEYLTELQCRHKWKAANPNIKK